MPPTFVHDSLILLDRFIVQKIFFVSLENLGQYGTTIAAIFGILAMLKQIIFIRWVYRYYHIMVGQTSRTNTNEYMSHDMTYRPDRF